MLVQTNCFVHFDLSLFLKGKSHGASNRWLLLPPD